MNNNIIKCDMEYEKGLRKLDYCVGCGDSKEIGLSVCWKCFKYRENPLKWFNGSVCEWLESIDQVAGSIN